MPPVPLIANPELKSTYTHFKAELEKQPNVLALLPNVKINEPQLTRSGKPGKIEPETTELKNNAVAIAISVLKSDNPTGKSRELLQSLNDNLTPPK